MLDFLRQRDDQAQRLDAIEGRYDGVLIGAVLALACLGVVMVASSSIAIAEGLRVGPFYFLGRHVMFLCGGLVLAVLAARTELKFLEKHSQLLMLMCFVLLLLVFMPGLGVTVNGARRWINLGVSNFQVVEAVKLLLIIWLASYLKRYHDGMQHGWRTLLKPLGVAAGLVVVLLMQPDFGSALLLLAIVGGMLLLGGASVPKLVAPALLALPVLAWAAVAESYRLRRLTSFMNPWEDPFKDGFQLTQALIAVGRGEWFGVGLGGSVQKLYYLPEAHTDFILAVIAEELGFVGMLLVIGLFAVITWRALRAGLRAVEMRRLFAGFCAFGVGLWISLQAFVSIGVNFGLLPTKGLTLPLVSSGGSSLLMTCAAIGLLLRVGYETERAERQMLRARETPVVDEAPPAEVVVAAGRAALRRQQRVAPTLGEPA